MWYVNIIKKMQLDVGNEPYLSQQWCLDHLMTWFLLECSYPDSEPVWGPCGFYVGWPMEPTPIPPWAFRGICVGLHQGFKWGPRGLAHGGPRGPSNSHVNPTWDYHGLAHAYCGWDGPAVAHFGPSKSHVNPIWYSGGPSESYVNPTWDYHGLAHAYCGWDGPAVAHRGSSKSRCAHGQIPW